MNDFAEHDQPSFLVFGLGEVVSQDFQASLWQNWYCDNGCMWTGLHDVERFLFELSDLMLGVGGGGPRHLKSIRIFGPTRAL